jgi:beta-lactamase regulating signal transducer with metallopeptidase domain
MHSLTLLFDWLLDASARASVLTVVVLILQALLGHRAPARWRYALWLPVLLVLIMPGFPESRWSVGSIIRASSAPLPAPVVMQQEPALTAAVPVVAAPEMSASIPWQQVISFAWLIGAAGMVLFSFAAFVRTLWRFKRSQVPVRDALLQEITALAREIGLRRVPRVWMSSEIRSPAVTGLLHPRLLLPAAFEQTLTAREARFVLRHELTHIKRGDLPLNALLCLLLALHWFNPLLWLAFFKARFDREAACDAQVLDRERQPERVAYGHTLLKVENAFSQHGLSLGFVGIFQRGIALRSRIQSIAKQPTYHITMKVSLSLCILLLTFLGITKAAPPDENAPQVLIEAKFIEVNDGATDLLTPFAATGASPSVSGMLNDDQLSTLWKKIEKTKGLDILSTPRMTTRSGQEAKVEIVREFAYRDAEGKPATKQLGTTLTVVATKGEENDIDLEVSPQIVELEGMIKDAKSGVEQPVFNERIPRVSVQIAMTSGQTVVLGFPPTSTKQTIVDSSPEGIITRTEKISRHMMLFVTARLVSPATDTPVDPETAAEKSPLQAKLDSIILPSVVLTDATLTEAVEFLRRKSLDLDTATTEPSQKGVNMIIKADGSTPEARITLNLKNVPLGEALKYVVRLAGQSCEVKPFGVIIGGNHPGGGLVTKQWQVPPTFFAGLADGPGSGKADAKGVLEANGIQFGSGATAAFDGETLTFKNTPEQVELMDALVAQSSTKRGAQWVLPKVQFQDATLTEAIEFLRIKSRELDPEKKGLNILVKPGGDPTASITMQLSNVPAYEALRYVAELAGCKLTVEGDVFVITPVQGNR